MTPLQLSRRLLPYLKPYFWPYFVVALFCMVAYSATSGAVPYLVRSLVDDIFEARDESMLRMLPGVIVAVFTVRALLNFGQAYLSEWVGQHIVFDLREALQRRVLHLPLSYLDKAATGNIVARINTDVLLVRQALTEGVAAMIRDTTTVVVLLLVVFYLDPVLALIGFVGLPSVVIPLQTLSRRMRKLSQRGLASLGGLSSLLQESIQGSRVVKAFGMEEYEARRFIEENERLMRLSLRAARIQAFTAPMMEVLSAFAIAALLYYGGLSVLAGGRSTGSFLAFLTAAVLIYEPVKKLIRTNNVVQTGLGAATRVFELLDLDVESSGAENSVKIEALRDAVRWENVSFSYDKERVLDSVNLEMKAGEVLALVGPSGGGKSTLADLLPRFYEVDEGRVSFDGIDVRDIDLRSLRALIAVVTQQTFLFNDTIRNNIAYGLDDCSETAIRAAAAAANAAGFIESFSGGYDTVVGEMGVQLSGGQRQRLAIARALLKDAPILILDEATSSLDTESERLVQSAIDRLMHGRSSLVIAHRLSTVRRADRIAVVDAGRIVASGTHEELLESSDLYRRLYEIQFQDGHGDDAEQAEDA